MNFCVIEEWVSCVIIPSSLIFSQKFIVILHSWGIFLHFVQYFTERCTFSNPFNNIIIVFKVPITEKTFGSIPWRNTFAFCRTRDIIVATNLNFDICAKLNQIYKPKITLILPRLVSALILAFGKIISPSSRRADLLVSYTILSNASLSAFGAGIHQL